MDQSNSHPSVLGFKDLGTLPELLTRIRDLLFEGVELQAVAEVIAQDPMLTVKVIAAAIDSSPAAPQKVQNVFAAVEVLQREQLVHLLETVPPRRAFSELGESVVGFVDVWANGVCCALSASALARKLAIAEPTTLYPIGLLHKLGRALLCLTAPTLMTELAKRTDVRQADRLLNAEKDIFGLTHTEAAAALLRGLGFSDEFVIPIEFQNKPELAPALKIETALLHLAAHIAQDVRSEWKRARARSEPALPLNPFCLKITSATSAVISEVQSEVLVSLDYVLHVIEPLPLSPSAFRPD